MATILNPIVPYSSPVVHALTDKPVSISQGLLLREASSTIREKILLHDAHSLLTLLKARQVLGAEHHHLDQHNYLFRMLLEGHEPLVHELSELAELLGLFSSEDINELLG